MGIEVVDPIEPAKASAADRIMGDGRPAAGTAEPVRCHACMPKTAAAKVTAREMPPAERTASEMSAPKVPPAEMTAGEVPTPKVPPAKVPPAKVPPAEMTAEVSAPEASEVTKAAKMTAPEASEVTEAAEVTAPEAAKMPAAKMPAAEPAAPKGHGFTHSTGHHARREGRFKPERKGNRRCENFGYPACHSALRSASPGPGTLMSSRPRATRTRRSPARSIKFQVRLKPL
jgi:outer membrane biosynthesis protein TonB